MEESPREKDDFLMECWETSKAWANTFELNLGVFGTLKDLAVFTCAVPRGSALWEPEDGKNASQVSIQLSPAGRVGWAWGLGIERALQTSH